MQKENKIDSEQCRIYNVQVIYKTGTKANFTISKNRIGFFLSRLNASLVRVLKWREISNED